MNLQNYEHQGEWIIPTGPRNFAKIYNPSQRAHLTGGLFKDPIILRKVLVQGFRRKIVVLFHDSISSHLDMKHIKKAAQIADKRGWKQVVVEHDHHSGTAYEMFNMAQFIQSFNTNFTVGIFICWRPVTNQQ